ncbi:diacylglycerol O-acyltransferase isoform X2 [Oratosquilla oratoria]|uniref:diacylglycerol O-acyltransferase isoform X2 n=1 Tax=Oratosquilla oratoria TaxID=337810 RepID=UPI003F76EA8C
MTEGDADTTNGVAEKDVFVMNSVDGRSNSEVRLRRTQSTSHAEIITEEERKVRASQPDRPIHKPRDSLLSWSSGFDKYEGIINWGALILVIGGLRLFLENVIKYGIRINPFHWFLWLTEGNESGSHMQTPIFLIASNVHIIFAFYLETLMAKDRLNDALGILLHAVHLVIIVLIPIIVLAIRATAFSLFGRTLICFVYTVMFLKLWSYAQVNYWCRSDRSWRKKGPKRSHSFRKAADKEDWERRSATMEEAASQLVQYPNNLKLSTLYYFFLAPTLCYELNFPRSSRIRKRFLLRRILEMIVLSNILMGLFQQWIIPSVRNSFQTFEDLDFVKCSERLLKLSVPNHLLWLIWFYLLFHSFLNILGELLCFADRNFYQDWWNAQDVGTFWRLWNLPVHKWAVRHVFIPMMKARFSKTTASLTVFIISAFFHEYLVSVPLQMYKIFVFLGMMVQVPLVYISGAVAKRFGERWGNMIVWASLILGQPLGIMVYYHDYVVSNFAPESLML